MLFSKFIRKLDHCERCAKTSKQAQLQTAHIYSRRYVNLRYDINNVLCLCASCHRWAHDNPLDFITWFSKDYDDRAVYLMTKKRIIKKWTADDYKKVIKELENYAN